LSAKSDRLQLVELVLRARDTDDFGTEVLAGLHGDHAHAGSGPRHEQRLSRFQFAVLADRFVRGNGDDRHRGRLFPAKALRLQCPLNGGHDDVFRERTSRAPENRVAGLERGDAFAYRLHLTRAIAAGGMGFVHLVQTDAGEDLAAVERGGAHAHQDLPRLRLRLGHFARLEDGFAVD
jgi:hypothetical protein